MLEKGRLARMGTHDELVRVPGTYRETALLQLMDLGRPAARHEQARRHEPVSEAARRLRRPPAPDGSRRLDRAREAITYFRPMEDREADRAPLSAQLIRRMFTYTRRYAARRNWLFVLTFARGLQLPALAWMIGQTINGPIAGRDLPGIYLHAGVYLVLVLFMVADAALSPALRPGTGRGRRA